ncbi:helix-turn-helix transcriptional regulator [Achromobacter deleyi]|uniref:helix-turn-helix transcriptional regulator n=1 Tax=Achromobacter deleyi TaxID=1353891 RepID=UPI0014923DA3|nr:helix-turn-helix transcriptional regulator [Achromobacter deleyi]QVQ26625.1 helix-turn-helix transcriptional regulator [Achromobacter deleyi]UIP22198.1 helix-turn-helix transcriptional regulator [Achromobacter deleyi]
MRRNEAYVTPKDAAPQAHRQHLQRIIAGLNEGIILLEADGSIAWANASALSLHGADELDDLGGTPAGYRKRYTLTYRNHHRVPARQYPLDRLQAAEAFDELLLDLSRKDDEEFLRHVLARGLNLDDDAGVAYRVLILHDQTGQINAEERFERTFSANPAPALVCRLSDLRYVKVNQGFLEMTGYTRDAVLGKSAYELDVLDGGEDKEAAVAKLNEGQTIAQREGTVKLPDGSAKFVVVAGQPIDMQDEPCMLFTFIDLEARKRTEVALRESEERFSKAFRLAPVPMAVCDGVTLHVLDINEAFEAATGASLESGADVDLAGLGLRPYEGMVASLKRGESARNREAMLTAQDGGQLDCLVSAEPVMIGGERRVLVVMQDITERKRSETELLTAIEAVMQDTSWFSRGIIEKLAQLREPAPATRDVAELAQLTSREREVLGLLCQGHDDDGIAKTLKLSRNTVRNHVATIYSKIGVHRRSAAIVWARDRGITGHEHARARDKRPKT